MQTSMATDEQRKHYVPHPYRVYVDGSVVDGYCGWAWLIERVQACGSGHFRGNVVFAAEITAVLKVLEAFPEHDMEIITDNTTIKQWIEGNMGRQSYLSEQDIMAYRPQLVRLLRGRKVTATVTRDMHTFCDSASRKEARKGKA